MARARASSAPQRAFLLLVLVLVAGLAPGARGEGGGERRVRKRSLKERDYENKFVNDEDDTVAYEKVKDTLRSIFAKGVEPTHAEDESIKDYLEPDFNDPDAFSNQIHGRNDLSEATSSLRLSPTRRRGLVQDDEELLEGAEDLAKRGYANAHRGTHAHSKLHSAAHGGREHTKAFLNEWAVHMTGGQELARAVGQDLGYQFLGQHSTHWPNERTVTLHSHLASGVRMERQVGELKDVYRLVKLDHPRTHKRDAPTLTHHLSSQAEVLWAEQQFIKERTKRSIPFETDEDPDAPLLRVKRISGFEEEEDVRGGLERGRRSAQAAKAEELERKFNDELWVHQWYLFDTRTRPDLPKLDLQVVPVWERGVTGKGVRVLVLDDGIEWRHKDIRGSYDKETSYDLNDNDDDPSPRYDGRLTNSHGTRCAGEIAMAPNNKLCGVGVAYGAKVGGVRMLDGLVSDTIEGSALGHALDKVDIVTCSWGPTDDGRRVEGPGRLAKEAIKQGVEKGRQGKGTIYVWAAGNGGSSGDNCNCDGYTSSIYTLSISSASESGKFPWYGERCASTLASAYSSGAYTDQKIATTDLHGTCTDRFSGTSAAAPLAAGIFALALEVNPAMTWRDMQHAVVWSSEFGPLSHNSGWVTNGRGLRVNARFGFGLLSAVGLVGVASNWTRVPDKTVCRITPSNSTGGDLQTGGEVLINFEVGPSCAIRSLEHVQVIASISYSRRGALDIGLMSPMGTPTTLLSPRVADGSTEGFKDWAFMSVHTWGEDPQGVWKLNISDYQTEEKENGTVDEVVFVLHGTSEIPAHMKTERIYNMEFDMSEEDEAEDDQLSLSSDHLRSLSWEQLVALLSQSTRSTFSEADVKMLLEENRLEETLRNIQSESGNSEARSIDGFDWSAVLRELMARR
ncbi:LOW QUALITY PROTEIN: neuroendocrine convertase 1-like [Penaeus chinensis]|uniref:LOW QUALITY PROTEIN: neuroendocrine convertase 1-like n=1 Tax=Penaeus chinensis TaxID=139456 RepID=UPI001FB6FBCA|nr:LOW QUALITY PROTEIN: neuroendocrine convertase 1-like [Penaeus chinensis]